MKELLALAGLSQEHLLYCSGTVQVTSRDNPSLNCQIRRNDPAGRNSNQVGRLKHLPEKIPEVLPSFLVRRPAQIVDASFLPMAFSPGFSAHKIYVLGKSFPYTMKNGKNRALG